MITLGPIKMSNCNLTFFSQVKEHICADCGKGYVEAAGARRCKHNKSATGGGRVKLVIDDLKS